MAFNIYLKIPNVPGESTTPGHVGEIVVTSYSWGEAIPVQQGVVTGRPTLSPLNILKHVDKASTYLMSAGTTGQTYQSMTLSLVRPGKGGGAATVFLQYTFTNVLVASLEDSGTAGGEASPTESVTFVYQGITVTYTPPTGAPETFTYNTNGGG